MHHVLAPTDAQRSPFDSGPPHSSASGQRRQALRTARMGREAPVGPRGEACAVAIDLVSGGVAGLCTDLTMHPLDTLKAKMQSQTGPPFRYRSMVHCFRSVLAQEGARKGLYAGFGAVLVGSVPSHALMFASYKSCKRRGEDGAKDEQLALIDFASGAVGELFALPTYVPAEVIAKRMQVATVGPSRDYRSTMHAARLIHATEGYAGLYAGTWPTLLRDVPFTAIQFSLFTFCKDRYRRYVCRSELGNAEATGLGFFVGAVAAVMTNPMDVVKTRLQIQATGSERKYHGVLNCLRRMVTEEGPSVLARGMLPRVLWVAPSSAIVLAVYEAVSRYLRAAAGHSQSPRQHAIPSVTEEQ